MKHLLFLFILIVHISFSNCEVDLKYHIDSSQMNSREKDIFPSTFIANAEETSSESVGTDTMLSWIFGSLFIGLLIFNVLVCFCGVLCLLCVCDIICLCSTCRCLFCGKKRLGLDHIDLLDEHLMEKKNANDLVKNLRINDQLFRIEKDELKLIKVLGSGGSSCTVFLVEWQGRNAAFKSFKPTNVCSDQQNFDLFEREVEILGSISHPNIIRYFGACVAPPRIGFVMEYCSNGDLAQFMKLKEQKKEIFQMDEKLRILREICSAMSFLHGKKIIHRDLKPENVLLDSTLSCKVMDFGLSKFLDQTQPLLTKGVGTSIYMSPEIVMGREYDEKTDVFSFGIMAFVVLGENFHPYSSSQKPQKLYGVEQKVATDPNYRPNFSNTTTKIPIRLQTMIRHCWAHDAKDRLSFPDIFPLILGKKERKSYVGVENEIIFRKEDDSERRKRKEMTSEEIDKMNLENIRLKTKVEQLQKEIKDLIFKYHPENNNNYNNDNNEEE